MFESLKFDDKQIACSQVQLLGFASNEMAFSRMSRILRRENRNISAWTIFIVIFFSLLLIDRQTVSRKFFKFGLSPPKRKAGKAPFTAGIHLSEAKNFTIEGILPLPRRRHYANARPKDSLVPERFYGDNPGVSPHNFKWFINQRTTCVTQSSDQTGIKYRDVFLLVAIASASWELERRKIIRKTWASINKPLGKTVKYVFFLGNDQRQGSEKAIEKEFEEYGDVVMENFHETYKNLTLKTQGQLKWVTHFCPNALYVMHVDDDVFADVENIVRHLLQEESSRLLRCAKVFKPVVRRDGKWEMSQHDYPNRQYPLSCVGWCFIMSQDVVNDLYFMSLDTFLIHLEDVTFTGILREKIGDLKLAKMPNGELLCQHKGWPKDRPTNEKLINSWLELKQKNNQP